MECKKLLSLLLFFFVAQSLAQRTLVIEFKKDDYSLLKEEQSKLRSFVDSLKDVRLESVIVTGHTDSDGSHEYNMELSRNRNQSVVNFLTGLQIANELIQVQHFGEIRPKDVNTTQKGQQKNRRVEITFQYAVPVPETIAEAAEQIEDCTQDTIITLLKGTLVKVNKCDFIRNPGCYKLKEYLDGESLRQENISTMTEDGQQLVSGGMLKYDICDGKTIGCWVPVSITCNNEDMDLWEQNPDGSWKKVSKSPLKTEVINNVRYYPLTLSGTGFCNLDKIPPLSLNKVKIKVRRGLELNQVWLSCDCDLFGSTALPKNKRKRKVVLGHCAAMSH